MILALRVGRRADILSLVVLADAWYAQVPVLDRGVRGQPDAPRTSPLDARLGGAAGDAVELDGLVHVDVDAVDHQATDGDLQQSA